MRVLFVNDTATRTGNAGCQLTSRTFHALLDPLFRQRDSLPWGFSQRLDAGSPQSWRQFRSGAWLAEPVLRALVTVEYGPDAIARSQSADLVLFQPEGTISDGDSALRILRFLSLPLWAALYGAAPVVVANGTFPLLRDERAALIRLLLQNADLALMRDRMSAQHWGVECAPDSAVFWDGAPPLPNPEWLLITTSAEDSVKTDLALGQAGIAAARHLGLRPLVLTKGWQRLQPLAAQIAELGGEIATTTALDQVDARIADCRLHVGGRYHMALLCATKGIPSALIRSNTHKNLWLAQDIPGIRLGGTPQALTDLAIALADHPPQPMRMQIRQLQDQTLQKLRALPRTRQSRHAGAEIPAATLQQLRRQTRLQHWKQRIRALRLG